MLTCNLDADILITCGKHYLEMMKCLYLPIM